MDGPRGRFRKGPRHSGRPSARRPPPPQTGLETAYLTQTQRAGTPLVVTLADGTKVCGRIQEFDRDQIVLEDSSGPIVIRKSEIRYLHEDA